MPSSIRKPHRAITPNIIEAHSFCTANHEQLKASSRCGCFYCGRIYDPREIKEWIEDRDGLAALCPHCGIDAVIAETPRYPITKEFLDAMYKYWF